MYSRNMPGGDRAELIDPFTLSPADGYAWLKGNLHSHTTCSDGRLSPQQRADAYAAHGYTFEQATFPLKVDARRVWFEVIAPDGSKAWSNPFDLTAR